MKTFKNILSGISRVVAMNFPLFIGCLILISGIRFSHSNDSKITGYQRFSQSFHSVQESLSIQNKSPFVFNVVKPSSKKDRVPSINAELFEFKANTDYLRKAIGLLDSNQPNISECESHYNFTFTLNQLVGNDLKSKKKVLSSSLFESNISKPLPFKSTILRI
jgi:hypothetical protein